MEGGPKFQSAEEIIKNAGKALERKELPFSVNNHSGIHNLELERIFSQTWNFIGLKSEIPDEGDYVQRYVGTDPVILTRDENGDLRVFLDICPHRGTKIVQSQEGNTAHFRCPYHGWTFKNTGELAGVPFAGAFDPDDLEELNLYGLRVESYKDLMFVTLNDNLPPLTEYIGSDFLWYLDLFIDLTKEGYELIAGPDTLNLSCNWKIPAENFAADWYHVPSAHKSAIDVFHPGITPLGASIICEGATLSHSLTTSLVPEDSPPMFFSLGHLFEGEVEDLINESFESERIEFARRVIGGVGTIFPNMSFIQFRAYTSIHKWRPIGPDETQVVSWVLAPREFTDEMKEEARQEYVRRGNSPSAQVAQDDHTIWNRITESSGSKYNQTHKLNAKYKAGNGPGIDRFKAEPHTHPRGQVVGHNATSEGTELCHREMWYRLMSQGDFHHD